MDAFSSFIEVLRETARKDWFLIAAVASITSFAAGFAHMHAYFSTLGFGGLDLSLPSESYFAIGAASIVGLFLPTMLLGLIVVAFVVSMVPTQVETGFRTPAWVERIPILWVVAGAAAVLALPSVFTWRWVAPLRALFPLVRGPWVELTLLLLILALFVVGYPIAFLRFRGKAFVIFLLATLLVSAPALAQVAGEQRARLLLEEPQGAPRVVLWRNATAAPEGYVVAHQDGDMLYLVVTLGTDANGTRIFHSTVIHVSDVARVVFIPAGADDGYAFRRGNGTEAG